MTRGCREDQCGTTKKARSRTKGVDRQDQEDTSSRSHVVWFRMHRESPARRQFRDQKSGGLPRSLPLLGKRAHCEDRKLLSARYHRASRSPVITRLGVEVEGRTDPTVSPVGRSPAQLHEARSIERLVAVAVHVSVPVNSDFGCGGIPTIDTWRYPRASDSPSSENLSCVRDCADAGRAVTLGKQADFSGRLVRVPGTPPRDGW